VSFSGFPVCRFAVDKKQAQDRLLNRAVMVNPELAMS
jgi:hypothetical protein